MTLPTESTNRWQLHDAINDGIHFDWAAGRLEIHLTVPASSDNRGVLQSIDAADVTLLRCPRVQPWGPSKYINSVTGPSLVETTGHVTSLKIEMQSGDEIDIEASSITITTRGSSTR